MKKVLIALCILTLLASCTSEDNQSLQSEDIRRADMVLENGVFTLYQEREMPITFSSSRVSFYEADNSASLDNMSFSQFSEDGSLVIEGRADSAELDTENRTMTLSGNVRLNSIRDNMLIETDGSLRFDTRSQEVETEDEVHVVSEDGEFSSSRFYGNLLESVYSFSNLKEGRIIN